MMALLPTLRADGTLFYLPPEMAKRLGVNAGDRLTAAQWEDRELQAMLASRVLRNEPPSSGRCTVEWHQENGYL